MNKIEKLFSKTSLFLKLASSFSAKDVQVSLNLLYPNEKPIIIDGEIGPDTIQKIKKFLKDNGLDLKKYQASFFNQKLWQEIIEKAKLTSSTAQLSPSGATSTVPSHGQHTIDLNKKFIEDIFCNLSNSQKIEKITNERIEQINSQNLSESSKQSIRMKVVRFLFKINFLISNFEKDIKESISRPEKIPEIGRKFIEKINLENYHPNIKQKIAEEVQKIIYNTKEDIIREMGGLNAHTVQTDLKKYFPRLNEDLFNR